MVFLFVSLQFLKFSILLNTLWKLPTCFSSSFACIFSFVDLTVVTTQPIVIRQIVFGLSLHLVCFLEVAVALKEFWEKKSRTYPVSNMLNRFSSCLQWIKFLTFTAIATFYTLSPYWFGSLFYVLSDLFQRVLHPHGIVLKQLLFARMLICLFYVKIVFFSFSCIYTKATGLCFHRNNAVALRVGNVFGWF